MTWLKIEDAPLEQLGYVWSPDREWGNRTDIVGSVHEFNSGRRIVSSMAKGYRITHWHPLLQPPKETA